MQPMLNAMGSVGTLSLPSGSSSLTAHPTDALDEKAGWVELGSQSTTASAEAFWYVIKGFTRDHHWNRTIYELTVQAEERIEVQAEPKNKGDNNDDIQHSPGYGCRYNALRKLLRKTPAPIGGGADGQQRTYECMEWTAQFIKESNDDEGNDLHIAVFGLVVPECILGADNPRGLRYWPFQYPKVKCYRFSYQRVQDGAMLRYSVIPLGEEARSARDFETLKRHSANSAEKMLTVLRKRAESYDPNTGASTYVKRVHHDNLLTENEYRQVYDELKVKYSFWVEKWTECTDPVKFVYEEMSIAAYLIALWKKERAEEGLKEKQTFLDCGCGNGFLVYLLISEGHSGIGVDLQKRNIWEQYPEEVTKALLHMEMDPQTFDCSKYDWLIGNHSDELSPWIPVMASRCQKEKNLRPVCEVDGETLFDGKPSKELRRAYPRFFILPCCFYDFDGRKVAFGRTRRTLGVRAIPGTGKYEQYCRWIQQISKAFGFTTEYENLRIPSTKYVSLLGRFVEYEERTAPKVIREMTSLLLLDARQSRL